MPTLRKGKRVVRPLRANVYYRTARRDPASIESFPSGLRVIAGNAKATKPQDPRIVPWGCTGEAAPTGSKTAPRCPQGERLRRLKLASGRIYTAHGDFFNAWDPQELGRLVRECLNADVHSQPQQLNPAAAPGILGRCSRAHS